MTLDEAVAKDILDVLPFGGRFLSIADVTKRVAPLRERVVRGILYDLYQRGFLELNRGGGGGRPALYGRRPMRRI